MSAKSRFLPLFVSPNPSPKLTHQEKALTESSIGMQMPAVCSPKTLDRSNLASLSYPHLIATATSPAATPARMVRSQDDLKRIAAHRAVELVKSGMVLGLGTGSTAIHALERIADLLNSGVLTDIVGIPTSKKTEGEARALGIPLVDLESNPNIDLSIDGADEVDPFLNLVKGRGGSLLREKMIEGASKRFVVIVDESKWVEKLGGSKMAVPVEVIPFGWKYTLTRLKKTFEGKVGFDARLRMKGEQIFLTDNLNYIIDLFFENGIEGDLDRISNEILGIVGVVEHGMFLGMATEVIIAGRDGVVVKTRGEVDVAAEQRRLTFSDIQLFPFNSEGRSIKPYQYQGQPCFTSSVCPTWVVRSRCQ